MDRLHPLYKSKQLKEKKVIFVFVGGGEENGTKEELHNAIKGLSKYLSLNIKNEFSFQALNIDEIKKQDNKIIEISNVVKNYI